MFLLGRPDMCILGFKAGGFNWLPQQKLKETPKKQILIDCCFYNAVSVISDNIYDEGFADDDISEKYGKRHPVLSYINKISDCTGIEEKGNKDEEQELDMSNM